MSIADPVSNCWSLRLSMTLSRTGRQKALRAGPTWKGLNELSLFCIHSSTGFWSSLDTLSTIIYIVEQIRVRALVNRNEIMICWTKHQLSMISQNQICQSQIPTLTPMPAISGSASYLWGSLCRQDVQSGWLLPQRPIALKQRIQFSWCNPLAYRWGLFSNVQSHRLIANRPCSWAPCCRIPEVGDNVSS